MSILRPTKEQIRQHYIDGIGTTCLVCDRELHGQWTDYNGEIRCMECGTTYQMLGDHLRPEFKAEMNLTEIAKHYCSCFAQVPLLREYWRTKGIKIPFGSYFGDSPITAVERRTFGEWLCQNADAYAEEFADSFNWEVIRTRYAEHAEAGAGI